MDKLTPATPRTDEQQISLADGKYLYRRNGGMQEVLRHGEPWRDITGDKFIYCMAERIDALETALTERTEQLAKVGRAIYELTCQELQTAEAERDDLKEKYAYILQRCSDADVARIKAEAENAGLMQEAFEHGRKAIQAELGEARAKNAALLALVEEYKRDAGLFRRLAKCLDLSNLKDFDDELANDVREARTK